MPESSNSQSTQNSSPKTSLTNTVPIRLSKSTSKTLRTIVNKCNKKSLGRKVKSEDVVSLALSLITDKEIEQIKTGSYSSQDHFEIKYKKYCENNGSITKDQI